MGTVERIWLGLTDEMVNWNWNPEAMNASCRVEWRTVARSSELLLSIVFHMCIYVPNAQSSYLAHVELQPTSIERSK